MNFKERYQQEMQQVKLEESFRDALSEMMREEQKKQKQHHRKHIIGSVFGIGAAVAVVLIVVPHIRSKQPQNELFSPKETTNTTYYIKGELPSFSLTTTVSDASVEETHIATLSQLLQRWSEVDGIACYEIAGVGTDCMLSEEETDALYEQFQQATPTEETVKQSKKCRCYRIYFQGGTTLEFRIDKNNNVQFEGIKQAYHL